MDQVTRNKISLELISGDVTVQYPNQDDLANMITEGSVPDVNGDKINVGDSALLLAELSLETGENQTELTRMLKSEDRPEVFYDLLTRLHTEDPTWWKKPEFAQSANEFLDTVNAHLGHSTNTQLLQELGYDESTIKEWPSEIFSLIKQVQKSLGWERKPRIEKVKVIGIVYDLDPEYAAMVKDSGVDIKSLTDTSDEEIPWAIVEMLPKTEGMTEANRPSQANMRFKVVYYQLLKDTHYRESSEEFASRASKALENYFLRKEAALLSIMMRI
jgi:hypothetical protein